MRFETKNKLDKIICKAEYQEDQNWIFCEWQGHANLETIKKWGVQFTELVQKTGCPSLLNYDKSAGPWSQSVDWLASELVPTLTDSGLRYYAHVVSHNVFSRISATELNIVLGEKVNMKIFDSLNEAKSWLNFQNSNIS